VIEFEDFGGEGTVVHFAHANAYPIRTYQPFLSQFVQHFHMIGMHQRPMWEGEDAESFSDWGVLADDLILFLESQSITKVIGMGHSMGGIATLLASVKRPDLFRKIVLIDPVILPQQVYDMQKDKPLDQLKQFNPMYQQASRRRDHWSNADEAKAYFESKAFFQRFAPSSQEAYLAHGIRETESGYTLSYSREWEAMIYATATNPWSALSMIKHPCMIIRGEHSDVMRSDTEWQAVKDVATSAVCRQIDGTGHLIPQEIPEILSLSIIDFFTDLQHN